MEKKYCGATDGSNIAKGAKAHAIALVNTSGSKIAAVLVTKPHEALAFTSTMHVIDALVCRERCVSHA